MAGPLAETLGRLDAAHGYCRLLAGAPPADDGWFSLSRLLDDPTILAGWYGALVARDDAADLAGSFLAGWLADVVADGVATAVHHERRGWPLDPAGVLVHRAEEGWFDGLAVLGPTVWVLPDDPAVAHPDAVVVGDTVALRDVVAADLVAVLTPLFAAVRRLAPYGTAGMWGGLADAIVGGAVWRAHEHGTDGPAAYAESMALVDAVAARIPALRARPMLTAVPWSGGTAHVATKGTCCLWYKRPPEPGTDGYCLGCPLRDPDDQQARWVAWLEENATS